MLYLCLLVCTESVTGHACCTAFCIDIFARAEKVNNIQLFTLKIMIIQLAIMFVLQMHFKTTDCYKETGVITT